MKKQSRRLSLHLCCMFIVLFISKADGQDAWKITAKDIQADQYYGVTVANGMIGIVSSPDPLTVKDVVLNGVYDNYQRGRVSNILKVFNHVNMRLEVDGQQISRKNIEGYTQTLDMEHAELETSFSAFGKIQVDHRMMALRHLPYSALSVITLTALDNIEVTPMSVIQAPDHLQDVHNTYSEIDRPHITIPLMTSEAMSPTGTIKVVASNSFIFDEPHGQEPDIIHEDWDFNLHLMKFKIKLHKGQTYRFAVVSTVCSSVGQADPLNEAERLTIFCVLEGTDKLIRLHQQAWAALWQSGNLFIEGDKQAERDIRFGLYHLYSFVREGTGFSLSPMGLSGLGYNGHVFWDTELWMYPPLLALQPSIARSLLEYRYQRLDAAKQNAFAHGFKGAMFPWESADDGSEETPVWALTGPFQHHISGCIAWASWKYFEITRDTAWLRSRGWPILKNVADFWASRVERNGPGHYDINNVIGADEWQENIDNDAFTNAVAILSLRYAVTAAGIIGETADPDWASVAGNIPILHFPDQTTRQNATYAGEEIKQADVNLLAYPLLFYTNENQIRKDLDYYAPKMSPTGPAMGPSVMCVLYNRIGDYAKSVEWFSKSYKPNELPPFGVLAETAGGTNPYFATGAGGMLQAVLFGFGGLTIDQNGLSQMESAIPASWKQLRIEGAGMKDKTYTVSRTIGQ
ncbi:MAG TPA: hypothetical protein VJ508_16545 [Saprospiraceae bacterium]|nr:hypothetical protein [Saprospiraceae bacterium]